MGTQLSQPDRDNSRLIAPSFTTPQDAEQSSAGAASDDPRLQTEAVQKAGKRFKRRGSLIGSRNAGGLWEFLTSRLRLMARMRMEWGNIHEV